MSDFEPLQSVGESLNSEERKAELPRARFVRGSDPIPGPHDSRNAAYALVTRDLTPEEAEKIRNAPTGKAVAIMERDVQGVNEVDLLCRQVRALLRRSERVAKFLRSMEYGDEGARCPRCNAQGLPMRTPEPHASRCEIASLLRECES